MSKHFSIFAGFLSATALVLAVAVPSAQAASCGNGVINSTEACDDGNGTGGDGCSSTCTIETGYGCVGTHPSVCTLIACGNGIVESGEACDGGACCLGNCTFASTATTCRGSAGACDIAENCSGVASTCPVDARSTATCRASAGACDTAETCDGTAVACPVDAKSTSMCRASTGSCDVGAETCDGVSNNCPADALVAGGTPCRASAGACDLAEACTGTSGACPVDAKSTGVCRASAGSCDLGAESCNGVSNDCPADALVAGGTPCRASAGACDLAEACTGTSGACPVDAKSTNVCRASAGACDTAESCNGIGNSCPADAKSTSMCRASAGACDLAETCDGTANACPVDAKSSSVCRASAGVCDAGAETCDGVSNNCPADVAAAAGSPCRASAGSCDVAETCDGTSGSCPADAKSTGLCRASAGECDLAESCDGIANSCPVDARSTAVCRLAISPECDVAESCDGTAVDCPADQLIGCADDDGVECTQAACDISGECVVTENCVEICRGAGFFSTHGGDENGGTNVVGSIVDAAGPLVVCGQEIDALADLGDLDSALEGLCVQTKGVQERQLYRQLLTTAFNCAISEGGTCDQVVSHFVDVSFSDCDALCAGEPVVDGPTLGECREQLSCFNDGGRLIDGQCANGNCADDTELFCGADYGSCPLVGEVEQECVRFADNCGGEALCNEDLEAPAQICIKEGRASSPKTCKEARKNSCTIDSCEQ